MWIHRKQDPEAIQHRKLPLEDNVVSLKMHKVQKGGFVPIEIVPGGVSHPQNMVRNSSFSLWLFPLDPASEILRSDRSDT